MSREERWRNLGSDAAAVKTVVSQASDLSGLSLVSQRDFSSLSTQPPILSQIRRYWSPGVFVSPHCATFSFEPNFIPQSIAPNSLYITRSQYLFRKCNLFFSMRHTF